MAGRGFVVETSVPGWNIDYQSWDGSGLSRIGLDETKGMENKQRKVGVDSKPLKTSRSFAEGGWHRAETRC